MSLRILHTADVHLGAKFLGLGRKGEHQREQLLQAFDETVNLAIRERVDLLLIAGDLFDSPNVSRSLIARVAYRLHDLAAVGIPVLVSPGTHDPYGERSIWRASELVDVENLTVFKSEEMLPVRFPELDCTIYGNANVKPFANKYPLASLELTAEARWQIGMLHASFEIPDVVEDTYIVTSDQVRDCGLDYVALGHYHSLSDRSAGGVGAFYPGSPEMVRMQKGDFGYVLLVEFDDGVTVDSFKVGKRIYEEMTIKAEDVGAAGMASMIESRADVNKVLHIFIEGVRRAGYPDVEELVASVSENFFEITCTDRSWMAPSSLEPEAYPEGSPVRLYLGVLKKSLEGASESEKQEISDAMQLGLTLLSEGDAQCE
ncbi:MAG: metallophosphoesterase family protein [Candidatus Geothermincolia bacterium]